MQGKETEGKAVRGGFEIEGEINVWENNVWETSWKEKATNGATRL